MRLIDVDALHNVFERYRNAPHVRMRNGVSEGMRMVINSCIEFLDNAKTIDAVEVVHGRWEQRESGFVYFCSNCEYWTFQREAHEWHYCPNCGTQMDGIEHE